MENFVIMRGYFDVVGELFALFSEIVAGFANDAQDVEGFDKYFTLSGKLYTLSNDILWP